MIPVGLAATVLSNVGSAISSGLSQLTGHSATTQSSQTSFASHLKAATGSTSASNATESKGHHHAHIRSTALSALADASQSASPATGSSVGSLINTSV